MANIFWQLANSFRDPTGYEDEKELALYISDNFSCYSDGRYGVLIDEALKTFLITLDHKFSEELMIAIPGEIIDYPIHTYEGVPQTLNDHIIELIKQHVRRRLP